MSQTTERIQNTAHKTDTAWRWTQVFISTTVTIILFLLGWTIQLTLRFVDSINILDRRVTTIEYSKLNRTDGENIYSLIARVESRVSVNENRLISGENRLSVMEKKIDDCESCDFRKK